MLFPGKNKHCVMLCPHYHFQPNILSFSLVWLANKILAWLVRTWPKLNWLTDQTDQMATTLIIKDNSYLIRPYFTNAFIIFVWKKKQSYKQRIFLLKTQTWGSEPLLLHDSSVMTGQDDEDISLLAINCIELLPGFCFDSLVPNLITLWQRWGSWHGLG